MQKYGGHSQAGTITYRYNLGGVEAEVQSHIENILKMAKL